MKTPITYLSRQSPISLALAGTVVIVALYFVGRAAVKDVAKIGGGLLSGNNIVTENQQNASGETVTAYQGAGIIGTLGAAVNSLLGGVPASAGEKIGDAASTARENLPSLQDTLYYSGIPGAGWLFDTFGPKSGK